MHRSVKYKYPKTLFQLPLATKQQVYLNYLLPITLQCLIYILNFATDLSLAIQHERDEEYIYRSITILWIYTPVLWAFFFTFSDVSLWPEENGFGIENLKWLTVKILQHLCFPVWAMYRYANQLFWSIEAARCNDEEVDKLLANVKINPAFELYHFLQAYLQAAPQIIFQMYIIFRHPSNFNKTTVDMQVLSIVLSLMKMAMTTTSYQRHKSQKITSKKYAWDNQPKPTEDVEQNSTEPNVPVQNSDTDTENSEAEADQDRISICPPTKEESNKKLLRKCSGLSVTSSEFDAMQKKIQKFDGSTKPDEPDFMLPSILVTSRWLQQDDIAGKLVAFLWWFSFILPRMLALAAFGYFYPKEIWYLGISHYVICLAFLLYDAHKSSIPYYRLIFLLFTAYVYMFCLIEFKIKFKKVKFIYYGFFILVYSENFVMTSLWYYTEEFYTDWWYNYIFYLICGSSILSVISMIYYITLLKPPKIIIKEGITNSKLL